MERVKLNIGGVRYETTRTTLTQYADSYFGAMFSGLHAASQDSDGYVFIDRDGDLFRHVLAYLRTGKVSLPQCKEDADAVVAELAFYGLVAPTPASLHFPPPPLPDFTRTQVQSLRASDARIFSGAQLAGVDLSKLSFDHVRLDRADLRGACLADTSLKGASLSGGLLQHADLRRSCLAGACCQAADLQHTDLRGAELAKANLSNADLRNARIDTLLPLAIDGANLSGLDLRGGVFPQMVVGTDQAGRSAIVLRGVDFRGADLRGVELGAHGWHMATWGFADCNFDDANLECARFEGITYLKGCTFRGANLTDAIVHGTTKRFQYQFQVRPDWGGTTPGGADAVAVPVEFQGATLTRASIQRVIDDN